MLRELTIENLAVIEGATAQFGDRFNVFTGETGAGKSILIGGINAILGQRTTKDIVRTGAPKAVISALFDDIPKSVEAKLSELGFEAADGELVLSREISADGKSTARINGRSATASMLREVGSMLVDVHGQHENRLLMSSDNQRELLDSYANLGDKLAAYKEKFRSFSQVARQLKALQEESASRSLRVQKLTDTVEELEALDLDKGEGDRLEAALEQCRSQAKIQRRLFEARSLLDGTDDTEGASALLQQAMSILEGLTEYIPAAKGYAERIGDALLESEEITVEINRMMSRSRSNYNEEELADRVSALKHARRKYNMDYDSLVDYLNECRSELLRLDGIDDELEQLSEQKRQLAREVKEAAVEITQLRTAAAERMSEQICGELAFLDMPNVRFVTSLTQDKVTINGMDTVEMLISANAGEEPKPLNKIASGGELSRIMLAIKSVLADKDDIPTLIFDEVDAGISGRAAQKVGIKLAETAAKRQVLCITHLAQIASQADCHLLIEKHTENGRTFTRIQQLDFEGRKQELARIIDGEGSSTSSLSAAEEMLIKCGFAAVVSD